jgi:hypothetical protein
MNIITCSSSELDLANQKNVVGFFGEIVFNAEMPDGTKKNC